jgi:hypothetical protein
MKKICCREIKQRLTRFRHICVFYLSRTRREIRESNTIEHKKCDKRNNVLKQIFFWNEVLLKWSMCWSRKNDETQKTRMNDDAFEKNLTKLSANLEREKENHQSRKKMKFRWVFCIIYDSSSNFWRLVRWAKSKSHRSKKILKIFDLMRRNNKNNVLECAKSFNIKTRLLFEFFFEYNQCRFKRYFDVKLFWRSRRND